MDFDFDLTQALDTLEPLGYFVLGVSIYAIFIFRFYRFVARRDVFRLELHLQGETKHALLAFLTKAWRFTLYIVKYLTVLPVIAVAWFAVLAVILTFMAKNQSVHTVLQMAVTVVAAVRITAYYNEDLSKDLAKMLPFALLGIFLVDRSFFSTAVTIETLRGISSERETVVYYLLFVIALEYALRIAYVIFRFVSRRTTRTKKFSPDTAGDAADVLQVPSSK